VPFTSLSKLCKMVVGQNHFAEPNQQACFDFSSFNKDFAEPNLQACFDFSSFNKDFAEPNLQACFDFSSFNKPFCAAKRASML
jgi:hypothetical protein